MSKKKREATSVEERYEEVRQLVELGREKGYLAYDEINEMLPEEVSSSPEEIDEVFSLLETHGIALVDADSREQFVSPEDSAERKEAPPKDDDGKPETLAGPLE